MSRPDLAAEPVRGRALNAGRGLGRSLVLSEPVNLWGGLDPDRGEITDSHHPQRGARIGGRVLVLPETRGSGTNAQVFAQACAAGVGPAAVLLRTSDYVLTVGALVAAELYAISCPVAVLHASDYDRLVDGELLLVTATDVEAFVTTASVEKEEIAP